MDSKAKKKLNDIIVELKSIIYELDKISDGIRNDFVGIGNDKCSNCIEYVSNKYRGVKRKLENIDTSTVKEGFETSAGFR